MTTAIRRTLATAIGLLACLAAPYATGSEYQAKWGKAVRQSGAKAD